MSTIKKKFLKRIYNSLFLVIRLLVNFFAKFNIPLSLNNYRILKLKNKYYGKRCFIIGNGPSLKANDLEKLNGEFTFASNKIYKIFKSTKWRPTFYMVVDSIVLEENLGEINQVEAKTKFTLKNYRPLFNADIFFNNNLSSKKRGDFSFNPMESLYSSGTVSYHMLQLAFYMGFTEVYLLGHDYNYKGAISKTKNLSFLEDSNNNPLYFSEDYINPYGKKREPAPAEIYKGMENAKLTYEKSGRKIYNVTRLSYLDVFDTKDFDELFINKPVKT